MSSLCIQVIHIGGVGGLTVSQTRDAISGGVGYGNPNLPTKAHILMVPTYYKQPGPVKIEKYANTKLSGSQSYPRSKAEIDGHIDPWSVFLRASLLHISCFLHKYCLIAFLFPGTYVNCFIHCLCCTFLQRCITLVYFQSCAHCFET